MSYIEKLLKINTFIIINVFKKLHVKELCILYDINFIFQKVISAECLKMQFL